MADFRSKPMRVIIIAAVLGTVLGGVAGGLYANQTPARTYWQVCVPNGAYLLNDTLGNPHKAGLVPLSDRIIRFRPGQHLSLTACGEKP